MKKRLFYETFEDFEAVKNYLSQIHQNGIEYEKTSKIQTLIEKLEKIGYSINILWNQEKTSTKQEKTQPKPKKTNNEKWENFKEKLLNHKEIQTFTKTCIKEEKNALLTIINRLDEYIEGTSSKEYIKNIVLYIVHAHTNNPPISNLLHCFDFIIKSLSKSKQSETIQNPKKEKNLSDELTDLGLVKQKQRNTMKMVKQMWIQNYTKKLWSYQLKCWKKEVLVFRVSFTSFLSIQTCPKTFFQKSIFW